MQPEKIIENAVLQFINLRPGWYAFKVQSTGLWDPTKKVYRKSNNRWHAKGVSDILAIYKGLFVALEIKTKTGRLSDNQKEFIKTIQDHEGVASVIRSIEDANTLLSQVEESVRREDNRAREALRGRALRL